MAAYFDRWDETACFAFNARNSHAAGEPVNASAADYGKVAMPKNAVIILAQGFEEAEAVISIDLLRRAGIQVTIAGLASAEVSGSRGITIKADTILSNIPESFDALILPGGQPGTTNLSRSGEVLDIVRESAARSRLIAAICAAPSVLGKAGILKGVQACCYPGFEDALTDAKLSNDPVVCDGNIITSRGLGTAIQFGLAIVRYMVDNATAEKIAKAIIYG